MRELREYAAFEGVFGPMTMQERADINGAITAWATAKAAGAKGVEVDDFMPKWGDDGPREKSDEENIAMMRAIQKRMRKQREQRGD